MSGAARRWAGALATVAVLIAGLVGCGEEETPAQQVPALADALAEVDAAAVADDDARLRKAVAALVRVTEDAEGSGDLDAEDADRIVTAAEELLAASGEAPPTETTDTPESQETSESPETPESPDATTPSPPSPPEGDEDDEGDDDGKPGKGRGKGDKQNEDDKDD